MTSKQAKTIQIGHEPGYETSMAHMNALVRNLNDVPKDFFEMRIELIRLVTAWKKSGPNLVELYKKDPELQRRTMHEPALFVHADENWSRTFDLAQ